MSKEFRTSVGGQALMEGIMMRGPEKICCAVRKPDGTIDLTYDTVTVHWYNRVPLVRGVCNMAENLYKGYRYLMHAADIAMEGETEPAESKLDKWFEEHATPRRAERAHDLRRLRRRCAGSVPVYVFAHFF